MLFSSRLGRWVAWAVFFALFVPVFGLPLFMVGAASVAGQWNGVLPSNLTVQHLADAVQKRAGEELVARKDRAAVPLMLEALGQQYDFLDDRQPRGVDVLARALAALDAHEAVPGLAAHLADPATPAQALGPLVAALGALGGPEADAALAQFLLRYHADPAFLLEPAPLAAAGEALVAAGGPTRKAVDYVAADKRTLAPLSRQLRAALDAAAAAKKKTTPEAAPERTE